jgi:hypothetical protein
MEVKMEVAQEAVMEAMKTQKKSKFRMFLNFLMYGGWILVIGVGLVTAIVLDMYVF